MTDRKAAITRRLKPSNRYSETASELNEQIQILLEQIGELEPMEAIRLRSALAGQLNAANTHDLGGA